MSINSAMLAGASGMRANSSALAAISDNIANVNTVGYQAPPQRLHRAAELAEPRRRPTAPAA
jgi:flagellar basal body rod protein FlgG